MVTFYQQIFISQNERLHHGALLLGVCDSCRNANINMRQLSLEDSMSPEASSGVYQEKQNANTCHHC
jgi:hypothetical protein